MRERWVLCLLSVLSLWCFSCSPPIDDPADSGDGDIDGSTDGDADADSDADSDEVVPPDSDLPELALTGAQPNHGPYTGGTEVLLRGRGFVEGLEVRFGARMVDPVDLELIDDNRLTVLTPAGDPGAVDVTIELPDGREATLEEGFAYDTWHLDPNSGSVAGGTLVRLLGSGVEFEPDSVVTFDGELAVDVTWVSSEEVTCRTPPGRVGGADVAVTSESSEDPPLLLYDGFSYFDMADPYNGGLGGGPIDGSVDVTVLDGMTRDPLPRAFVILGSDSETEHRGYTDGSGRITFSAADLRGRQSITAGHAPVELYDAGGAYMGLLTYESTTIVAFDARSVTILLEPIPPPNVGPPPTGRRGGYIEGELLFEHRGEFGPYEWDIVPEPRDPSEVEGGEEVKVAFVYTSSRGTWTSVPEPRPGDTVLKTPEFMGPNGYRFSLYTGSGTVAVWAMAGLGIQTNPGETPARIVNFVPYVMGVARGVVVGPDETVSNVFVYMTRQMHRDLTVVLDDPPLADDSGRPNTYIVSLYLDLGTEGRIIQPRSTVRSANPFVDFDFPGWIDLDGNLSGASYTAIAGAWTTYGGSDEEQNPWSSVLRSNITDLEEEIVMDGFLGVPRAVSPEPGGVVVEGGRMEWEALGATPDFSMATLTIPGGIMPVPYWLIVLRGGETSYELPNLPAMDPEMTEFPEGDLNWQVWSFSVDGFEFDEWSYRYFYSRYWSAYAADSWYIRLAE